MTRIHLWLDGHWQLLRADAARLRAWAKQAGPFYCGSALAHVVAVLVLLSWSLTKVSEPIPDGPDIVDTEIAEAEPPMFILGTPPVRLSELSARSLAMVDAPGQTEKEFDDSPLFEDAGGGTKRVAYQPALGGLGGFVGEAVGEKSAAVDPTSGVGIGIGTSLLPGNGGGEEGFNGLGSGKRLRVAGVIDTEETERSVAAALNWLRRHQHEDGSWSLSGYACHCRGQTCLGACDTKDDTLATALGLLTFLSAGQSHTSEGPYQRSLDRAVQWLLSQQLADGGFSPTSSSGMHTHHIATLALCECYAITGDSIVGDAVERAIQFSEHSWMLGMDGWRCAIVVSARRADLAIDPTVEEAAAEWLAVRKQSRQKADDYLSPIDEARLTQSADASAVFYTAYRLSPALEPLDLLPANSKEEPTSEEVIDCFLERGEPARLDRRRALLAIQAKDGCASGSWPNMQAMESLTPRNGRLPTTCFAAILLSAGYRHLPMHRAAYSMPLATRPEEKNSNINHSIKSR